VEAGPVKKSFTIRDLPVAERPRERLQKFGAEALSAPEILAVILGRGIAEASVEELAKVRGIGLAKAAQLKAAFELANRLEGYASGDKPSVKTPEEVVGLVRGKLRAKKKEHFLAILLDTRGQVIKIAEISVGSLDASIVHPREVFREAMTASAASVIFVHNHPSGNPEPSEEDVKLTERLAQAGEIVGIDVLDHIIIGDKSYLSLKRKGLF
jgi:DNA repair protein RadC